VGRYLDLSASCAALDRGDGESHAHLPTPAGHVVRRLGGPASAPANPRQSGGRRRAEASAVVASAQVVGGALPNRSVLDQGAASAGAGWPRRPAVRPSTSGPGTAVSPAHSTGRGLSRGRVVAGTIRAMANSRGALIVVSGLPGAGKTTVTSAYVRPTGAAYLRIDTIEQTILNQTALVQPLGPVGYEVGYALAGEQLRLGTKPLWRSASTRS
jgi:hypothetical protein